MSRKEHFINHALKLGKIVGNLQTIEMAARLAIVKLDHNMKTSGTLLDVPPFIRPLVFGNLPIPEHEILQVSTGLSDQ
jgi:hypothetical protein